MNDTHTYTVAGTNAPRVDGIEKVTGGRGHDVLLLHLMDDDELDFPFNGATQFEGLEAAERLSCNPRALRDGDVIGRAVITF